MTASEHLTEAEKDLRREQIRSAATRLPGNRAQRRAAARRLLAERAHESVADIDRDEARTAARVADDPWPEMTRAEADREAWENAR